MDGVHDLGGMHGFGPVVVPGSERVADEDWELRVFALSAVIDANGLAASGGRTIREELDPVSYLAQSYYERWVFSTEQKVLRSGAVTRRELDEALQAVAAGAEPERRDPPADAAAVLAEETRRRGYASATDTAYVVGDRVRVRRMRPAGHTRCPRYVRGATGVVEAVRGADVFPDVGPYAGPLTAVYAVAFSSDELFGPSEAPWTVSLDLYEPYLETA